VRVQATGTVPAAWPAVVCGVVMMCLLARIGYRHRRC
jgi:hypothetical protein